MSKVYDLEIFYLSDYREKIKTVSFLVQQLEVRAQLMLLKFKLEFRQIRFAYKDSK